MGDVAGTLKNVTIDGISYDAIADADVTQIISRFTNESIASSGRKMLKKTVRPQTREGIVIICNPSEADVLKNLADSTRNNIPLSYTLADGSVYTAEGWIEFESVTTMENRGTLKMYEKTDWELFVA